jgi:outer membrane protein
MKITKLIYLVLMLTLSTACGNKKIKEKDNANIEAPVFKENGLKIGFYYADSLNTSYAFMTEANKEMEAKINQLSNTFQSKVNNFQNWASDKEEKAQKGLLLSSEIQAFQQESQERQYNLQQEQQQLQLKIQDIQAESMTVAINRVEDFVHRFAKEHGYDLILQYSKGGQISFVNPEMNITSAIVDGLNQEYQASKSETKN